MASRIDTTSIISLKPPSLSSTNGIMAAQPHFRPISVQTKALDAIMNRLNRLKDHKVQLEIQADSLCQMQGDSLWLDDDEPRLLTVQQVTSIDGCTPSSIINTLASMRRMKTTLATLKTIVSSLEEVITTVGENTITAVRHYGINSIPGEILSHIIGYACDPTTLQHLKISHVCRRFRKVAIEHSQLWTYITHGQSDEWRNLQLSRSRNSPLIIDFSSATHGRVKRAQSRRGEYSYSYECTCAKYLAFVVKYAHRWGSFTFAVAQHDSMQVRPKLQALLTNLHLPLLEHLSISRICTMVGDSDVFLSWKTPKLQRLQCCQDLRPLLSTLDSGSYIKSLDLTMADLRPADKLPSRTLRRFLFHPKSVAVEHLSLTIDKYYADSPALTKTRENAAMDVREGIPNCLPSLRTLSIDVSYYASEDIFNRVLTNVQLPKLFELSVSFDSYRDGEDRDVIRTRLEKLMKEYDPFLDWLGQPMPEFRKQFASLTLLRIKVTGHKKIDEKALENTLNARLRGGWNRVEFDDDHMSLLGDYDHNAPEIQTTFKARSPPVDDSDSY